MKVAVITDTHFGVRGDSPLFLDNQKMFYDDVFFSTLEKEGITTLLHLGDLFDKRKSINFLTLSRTKEMFLDKLLKKNIQVHLVAGNHDCFYKNTNEINSVELLLEEYPNIHTYTQDPVELKLGSCSIMLSPWLSKDNEEVSFEMFKKTKCSILAGHFEFQGFEMTRGNLSKHGLKPADFMKFEMVWSGHFHIPSVYDNVEYLGAPYEMDWSDYDGIRGFHIFDTETKNLVRVRNPHKLHHKIVYDDTDMTIEDIADLDVSMLKNCFVMLVVGAKTSPHLFEMLVEKIENSGAADVKIVEDALSLENVADDSTIDEAKDTREILYNYIDDLDTKVTKSKVKDLIGNLYIEAINL
jgi:DNA repair exonuclease SbcCD nuclease subunit